MLRAIVFDFDGVLANSEPLHYQSFRDVLAQEGVALAESEYYARYLGFDDAGSFAAIARDRSRAWNAGKIQDLIARKAIQMEELERHRSVLFPGAADVVRRAAATLPLAIASGALGFEIRRILDREQLTACFTTIVAAEDTPSSKPSPAPYLRAIAQLRSRSPLSAAECVAVEDSLWGLESARRAGLRTVAVAHTYPAAELAPAADLVVAAIADLDLDRLGGLCAR